MKKQRGGIAPLILVLLVIVAGVIAYLVYSGKLQNPVKQLTGKEPTVSLQTKYSNPFDANSQYVNPFNSYKNPFDNLK